MRTAAIVVATIVLAACGKDNPASPTILSVIITSPTQTIAVGETVQLTATARDVNGLNVPNAKVTYAASPASVIGVNDAGRVIGVAPGNGSVIATSAGQSSPPDQITVTASGSVAAVVTMQPNTFTPFTTTIRVGQTVAFDFPSLAHNVTFAQRTGKPADIPATQNQTVNRTFTTAGTFPFDCTIHPGMSGQVIVNP
jgi:plastocyanin